MYNVDKQAETVAAKTELSVLQVKVEGLESEVSSFLVSLLVQLFVIH